MQENFGSESGFFHSRMLVALTLCAVAMGFGMLSIMATSPKAAAPAETNTESRGLPPDRGSAWTLMTPQAPSDWSIVNSPNPPASPTPNYILSTTCATASHCWAVGYWNDGTLDRTLIEYWNGTAWAVVTSPNSSSTQQNYLYAVTCAAASNCWAVGYYFGDNGYQTLIEHWNGTAWNITTSPNNGLTQNNILTGVTCASSSNCWAVGYFDSGTTDQTLIEHWDGATWSIVNSANTNAALRNRLFGVTCSSAPECWAVGFANTGTADQPLMQRWDGTAWLIVAAPTSLQSGYLLSITCTSSSDCWSVGRGNNGSADQTLIEHWNGNAWAVVSSPDTNPARDNFLSAITCTAASDCWAVGYYLLDSEIAYQSLVEHWDGVAWTIKASPNTSAILDNVLYSVTCASGECWTIGFATNDNTVPQTLVEHWNGTAWTIVSSDNKGIPQGNFLSDVACGSTSDCWAVGYFLPANETFTRTLVEHWDGSGWTIASSPDNGSRANQLNKVTCTDASDCWAVGYYGNGNAWQTLIEHWDGTAWVIAASPNTSTTLSNYLLSVTCASASQCWAIGYANDGITAYRTLIEHWDGTSWTIATSPNIGAFDNFLTGSACTSASDCWAVGYYDNGTVFQTLIEHWNGTVWSIEVTSSNSSIVQSNYLNDISCTSASDCWAAGRYNNGTADQTLLEHWNGTLWTVVASPNDDTTRTNYLYGIACSSTSNCWAAGYYDNGRYRTLIEHWDGNAWTIAPSPNMPITAQNVLTGVTCASATSCWASGFYGNGVTLMLAYPAVPLLPANVVSRKIHGGAGPFDLNLPAGGTPAIECRSGGTNGDYTLVFSFPNNLTTVDASSVTDGIATIANSNIDNKDARNYLVNLTGVASGQKVTISLTNVTDATGSFNSSIARSVNILIGDTNADTVVNSADIGQTKSQSGNVVTENNFREDLNADGVINSADIGLVKSKSGTSLP